MTATPYWCRHGVQGAITLTERADGSLKGVHSQAPHCAQCEAEIAAWTRGYREGGSGQCCRASRNSYCDHDD